MKAKLKHYSPLIITICFLIFIIVISVLFSGYKYDSDIECIMKVTESGILEYKETLCKIEGENKEIVFYNNKYGEISKCNLKKKNFFGTTKYKFQHASNSGPDYFSKDWTELDDNLKYIAVKYEDDIKNIDCEGYKPVGTKINYKKGDGKETSCWIYVIDKTKQ